MRFAEAETMAEELESGGLGCGLVGCAVLSRNVEGRCESGQIG